MFGSLGDESALSLGLVARGGGGGSSPTTLRREPDGSVTIVSVGSTWQPILTRQSDGTVTVGAA